MQEIRIIKKPITKSELKKIGRAREVFCDAIFGGKEYGSTLADLEKYFNRFALLER